MFISETKFIVRYAETDQMGIVHHSNYPVWFEAARTDFFRKLGFSYSQIEKEGILLPLTEMKCCFKSPAKYEDEIGVRVKIVKFSCVRVIFSYDVYNCLEGNLLATGETAHAWTDKNLKPLNLEKRMPGLYEELKRVFTGS